MQCENEKRWNIVFFLLGGALVLLAAYDLSAVRGVRFSLLDVSIFDFTLMSLAVFRLVRLFVYDRITQFIRDWFIENPEMNGPVCACDLGEKKSTGVEEKAGERCYASGFKASVSHLLSCPWCVGVWAALPVAYFYILAPVAKFPILVLAIAGVASLLQLLANLIGWKAEGAKRNVERQL